MLHWILLLFDMNYSHKRVINQVKYDNEREKKGPGAITLRQAEQKRNSTNGMR